MRIHDGVRSFPRQKKLLLTDSGYGISEIRIDQTIFGTLQHYRGDIDD